MSTPWSAIDSITQNEESKIDYDYVITMRNNKFKHTGEKLQTTPVELSFSPRFESMESDRFHNHSIT